MISVVIPAHNEENYLGACLSAVLASGPVMQDGEPVRVQVIVVANACTDRTAELARAYRPTFDLRGWELLVLNVAEGGKPNALNVAETRAWGKVRIYLDADITVGPALLQLTWDALQDARPRYASGQMQIAEASTFASRAYREIYRRVPFQTQTIPGAGYFAVNAAGRARWGRFPDIIADDLFVRLQFDQSERVMVGDSFRWELTEGFRDLIRVRKRQDRGTRELMSRFPELRRNEDKPGFRPGELRRLALGFPLGMSIYCAVSLLSRMSRGSGSGWARGRR